MCDLASVGMPWACEGKALAPAYAYSVRTDECYQLGNLENDFAVSKILIRIYNALLCIILQYPLDPLNSSVGIRIVYTNGGIYYIVNFLHNGLILQLEAMEYGLELSYMICIVTLLVLTHHQSLPMNTQTTHTDVKLF